MNQTRVLCALAAYALSLIGFASAQTVNSGNGTTCGDTTTFKQCGILPVQGGTYSYPLNISVIASSPDKITGWAIYVNGTQYTPDTTLTGSGQVNTVTGVVNTTLSSLPAGGPYTIGVNTWDAKGTPIVYEASNVYVRNMPATWPTIPSNATVFPDLQKANSSYGTWSTCSAATCSGGSGGTGSLTLNATIDAKTLPASLSGSTMKETSNGGYVNTLAYRHACSAPQTCTNWTHFVDDLWFYIPALSNLQALEFDPDIFNGSSFAESMSTQCNSVDSKWRFYDSHAIPQGGSTRTGDWTEANLNYPNTTYACNVLNQPGWHHYQLYGTMSVAQGVYNYQTLVIDGVAAFENISNQFSNGVAPGPDPVLNIQQQIDNGQTATSNSIYYDNYKLIVW